MVETRTKPLAVKISDAIAKYQSCLCVGLDPNAPQVTSAPEAEKFCLNLIEATMEYACAYKPNSAFFEQLGSQGFAVLEKLRQHIPQDKVYILDAKRGDIDNTGTAYAKAAFEIIGADAVTVNPLMGSDSVAPFLNYPTRGAFILVLTSNNGSADILQQRLANQQLLYEHIANLSNEWGSNGSIGFVVSALNPIEVAKLRAGYSQIPFLIPGVGAQGGSLEDVLKASLGDNQSPTLINVSRSLAQAPEGPTKYAASLVMKMRAFLG